MISFFPFILIILGLVILIVIVVRKFPQLSLLDVENIPEVVLENKKDNILKKRLAEKHQETDKARKESFKPLVQNAKNLQLVFRKYVGKIERSVIEYSERRRKNEPQEKKLKKREDLRILLQEGQFAFEQKSFEDAEKKFLSAIKIDPKNFDAYLGLSSVYSAQNNYNEAKETLNFLLQLNSQNETALVKLAEIYEQEGKKEEAIEFYQRAVLVQANRPGLFAKLAELLGQAGKNETALEAISQAVEIEPQNPRYLDMMVMFSVLCGNKKIAEKVYHELRMVNPENQKLAVLKDKIDNMPG
ncbi:MAG: Tetratricopeptide TPR_2 repeat-containing protein [Candidatus Magasanikbacteria bacterium GW2011_GWC2_37_14]|uniref:Tetratricopeptide TPR_2 repeat-containing protein n=1 Tax=Candidatus Magasanikbacteria bacterium GW2011_GWC2_37_14 TaxID=1619046 RepID=A0A0G0IU94_9BACT|nr:MAG: Tetratricopeptide TPR_2 repeat-containing protein [Candidatus Magasanikbacteria bacterium GW2011_GWC2_37_14]